MPDNKFLRDFPILNQKMNGKPIVYLDNGATTQKPESVVRSICGYYGGCNANPHRGAYQLSIRATELYESAREKVAQFINAPSPTEIIFTKNSTESLNLLAYSYGLTNVRAGDSIVMTISEHHSNLVPWQRVAQSTGASLEYIYLNPDGTLSDDDIAQKITERTKIVATTHVSNVLGIKNDVRRLADRAHSVGAILVVDGAQSVPHMPVDVQALGADFLAFSGHKMLAPMGIGVLFGRAELLDAMPPFLSGGDMIEYVEEQSTTYAELPAKFEAGTQNVEGAVGITAAIDYINAIGFETIERIERQLLEYALPRLRELPFVELYGCDQSVLDRKTGIITFNVRGVHPHDVSTILDLEGVAIRAGHHCAQPLTKYLGQTATCRASFYFYNTADDIDRLLAALNKVRKVLHLGP